MMRLGAGGAISHLLHAPPGLASGHLTPRRRQRSPPTRPATLRHQLRSVLCGIGSSRLRGRLDPARLRARGGFEPTSFASHYALSRDFCGRQIVSVKGHAQKLEVSRSFTGLFKGM